MSADRHNLAADLQREQKVLRDGLLWLTQVERELDSGDVSDQAALPLRHALARLRVSYGDAPTALNEIAAELEELYGWDER